MSQNLKEMIRRIKTGEYTLNIGGEEYKVKLMATDELAEYLALIKELDEDFKNGIVNLTRFIVDYILKYNPYKDTIGITEEEYRDVLLRLTISNFSNINDTILKYNFPDYADEKSRAELVKELQSRKRK